MEGPSHPTPASSMYMIRNTREFDHRCWYFSHGVAALEKQVEIEHKNDTFYQASTSSSTEVLLNIAKALVWFLSHAESLQSPPAVHGRKRSLPLDKLWINPAITDLRSLCHRYRWAANQFASIIEKRAKIKAANADRGRTLLKLGSWRNQSGNEAIRDLPKTPSNMSISTVTSSTMSTSISTTTSVGSWGSDPFISTTGSMTTTDSDPNDDGDDPHADDQGNNPTPGLQFLGDGAVQGGVVTEGSSTSTASSHEYPSHW